MSLERWAEMARDWKDALCAESPMADFGEVRVIVEVDGGYTVVMAAVDQETGVGGLRAHLAGVLARMDRGGHTRRTGRAAVVADCYVSPRDTVCDPAKVYAEDPGTGATLAVLVIDAGPEGLAMCLLPYRWGDDGTPVWDDDGRVWQTPSGDLADLARFAADPWGAS